MRLLTRSDFDGICSAVLLKELGIIGEMIYAHPKDLQDGKIAVTADDVLANVPYVEGCGLWFDHHSSESERLGRASGFTGSCWLAPSTARVIYNYYNDPKLQRFHEMVQAVDKVDSGELTREDILVPRGWVLLGYLCDPRTGLGYHHQFKTSNLALMSALVEHMRTRPIEDILELPDVRERIEYYIDCTEQFKSLLLETTRLDGTVAVTDTRGKGELPPGNRFLVYALFPKSNVSIRLIDGKGGEFVAISVGHSVLNRGCKVDVGSLLLKYGGGGHERVGTCQVRCEDADRVADELLAIIKARA